MNRAVKKEKEKDKTDSMDEKFPHSERTLHDILHGKEHEGIVRGIELRESLGNLLDLHRRRAISENEVLVTFLRSDAYNVHLRDVGNILKISAERVRQVEENAKKILAKQKKITVRKNPKPFSLGGRNSGIN